MMFKEKDIRKRIEDVIKIYHDDLSDKQIYDFAFHMTDWLKDLEKLVKAYTSLDKIGDKNIYDILLGFCIHVPLHIVKANEIIMDEQFSLLYEDYE